MLRINACFLMGRRLRGLPACLVYTAAAHTHHHRNLYTSRCCLALATPPRQTLRRGAADSLLSQWSRRRTPAPQTSTTLVSASPAAPNSSTDPQGEDATGGFSIEELLVFDESTTPSSAEFQSRNRIDGLGAAAAKLRATPRSPEPYTMSGDHDDAVRVEDADGYGMAASVDTTKESTLMDDLLRQAALGSEVEDEEAAAEASAASFAEENDSNSATSGTSASRDGGAALPTSGVLDAVEDRGDNNSDIGTAESMETAESTEDGSVEEKEEESMDTVLEEETERMLQAALANMMKESATSATASAAGSERQQVKGTGGYVFFTKEAVLAAVESLAASEKTALSPDNFSFDDAAAAAAAAVGQSQEDGAGFDDDVVRAAEMESLGLDVETSRR